MSAKVCHEIKLPFRQLIFFTIYELKPQQKMKSNDFMNDWLKLALKPIKAKGCQSRIVRNGHMSTHVFTYQDPASELSISHFIRVLVNFAMLCDITEKRQEFMDYWSVLGREIVCFAESPDADDFNRQFMAGSKCRHKTND